MAECAFDHGTQCKALTVKNCRGCRFRKTQKEHERSRHRAEMRIRELGEERSDAIWRKYYNSNNVRKIHADEPTRSIPCYNV